MLPCACGAPPAASVTDAGAGVYASEAHVPGCLHNGKHEGQQKMVPQQDRLPGLPSVAMITENGMATLCVI